jgi:fatty-acyl-CoA synthase
MAFPRKDAMLPPKIAIHAAGDIAAIERRSLDADGLAQSSYEALQNSAARFPNKLALKFFIDGDCYNPRRIPWRARLRALGGFIRYRHHVARPFETFTFEHAAQRVSQTARLLQHCGVVQGDVVSLLLPNLPETMFCGWAAETVGVLNPINPLLDSEIIGSIMVSAGTKVLVTMGHLVGSDIWEKVERIRMNVPTLQTIIVVRGNAPPECLRYDRAIARFCTSPLPRAEWPQGQQLATLFHTGGTTGLPKLVRGTHRNKVANAQMLVLVSPLSCDDVGLIALPMFHVNAAMNALIGLLLGMTTVIAGPAGFRTQGVRENFLKILEAQRISYFSAVPSIFAALLQGPSCIEDLTGVRFAISAASALPVQVMRAFTEKTGIRILEGYGQTEATVATCLNPYLGPCRPGSVGLRLPFARVKTAVLGEGKVYLRDCVANEIGHLLIAGEHVGLGYLDPRHDEGLWVQDKDGVRWLNSGDLARIDPDDYVWITGRAKELIIRGGHNIDPRMIEEALQSHPDVVMAAAVGRPHPQLGEVPVAYVLLKDGACGTEVDLMRFAEQRIPERAAWPKLVTIVDRLPLTAIGKVFKPELIQREQEAAFTSALQPLHPLVSAMTIQVLPHPTHGLVAKIRCELQQEGDRETVSQQITQAMALFTTHFVLTVAQPHFHDESVAV